MTDHTVIRFPGGTATPPRYTDTAALNDIHAILCRRSWDPDARHDVAEVLARCGRPVVDIRDIEAAIIETPAGLPEAQVEAGATGVRVYQDQSGGLAVAVTATAADEAQLTITLNQRQLHPTASR